MAVPSVDPRAPKPPARGPEESSFDRLVMAFGIALLLLVAFVYFLVF